MGGLLFGAGFIFSIFTLTPFLDGVTGHRCGNQCPNRLSKWAWRQGNRIWRKRHPEMQETAS
jgi:hypothetical protein